MRKLIVSMSFASIAVATSSCGQAVTCGAGTRLDEETKECRSTVTPVTNVVIEDFSLGDFGFSDVDVPEQLQPGFPVTKSFTIQNTGEEAQPVTLLRFSVVPVNEVIDELADAVDAIGAEASCEVDADCPITSSCDTANAVCKINATMISSVVIEDLAPGEERTITHEFALPPSYQGDGLYGLLFSVNEVKLIKADDGLTYVEDPEHAMAPNEDPFARAAALYPAATMIVGTPDKPNLRVLFANVDQHSFSVPDVNMPIMNVSGRLSAQGRNVVAPVHVRFQLEMPGHVIEVAGKDLGLTHFIDNFDESGVFLSAEEAFDAAPDATTFIEDENRVIPLLIDVDGAGNLQPQFDLQSECADEECTTSITIENDLGRDLGISLHLSAEDKRLLGLTAGLADVNSGLDPELLELNGTVRMLVSTDEEEYQVNGAPLLADNEETFEVVFLAPEAGRTADPDNDTDVPAYDEPQALYPVTDPGPDGLWDEVDNLTPEWSFSVGGDAAGLQAKISNRTSKQRQYGGVVAQNVVSDNYARINALWNTFYIVQLTGNMDWGTRRDIEANRATGRLQLLGTTYLDITYTPGTNCNTQGDFKSCLIFGDYSIPERDAPAGAAPAKKSGKKIKVQYAPSKSYWFAVGPLPFQIEIGLTLGLGMKGDISWVQKGNPAVGESTRGLQVTYGPIAQASGNAFGGLSIALLRAGIAGSLTFVSLEFQPALLVGITQHMEENRATEPRDCWLKNGAQAIFTGPLTFKQLYGDVKIVVEGGICICLPWAGCPCVWGEIWSYTIYQLNPLIERTWDLFNVTKDLSTGGGMCPGAPPAAQSWSSPGGCRDNYGRNAYCNFANGTGSFAKVFTTGGTCKTLRCTGETEANYDFVTVSNSQGTLMHKSGGINDTMTVCSDTTVSLRSDYSVVRPGVSCTLQ